MLENKTFYVLQCLNKICFWPNDASISGRSNTRTHFSSSDWRNRIYIYGIKLLRLFVSALLTRLDCWSCPCVDTFTPARQSCSNLRTTRVNRRLPDETLISFPSLSQVTITVSAIDSERRRRGSWGCEKCAVDAVAMTTDITPQRQHLEWMCGLKRHAEMSMRLTPNQLKWQTFYYGKCL